MVDLLHHKLAVIHKITLIIWDKRSLDFSTALTCRVVCWRVSVATLQEINEPARSDVYISGVAIWVLSRLT